MELQKPPVKIPPDVPPKAPLSRTRIILEWISGILLILLGIIGILLPVMQGLIFLIPGLAILSRHARWAKVLREKFEGMGRGFKERVRNRGRRKRDPEVPPSPSRTK